MDNISDILLDWYAGTAAICLGDAPAILTASGFPKLSSSRPASRRAWTITCASRSAFPTSVAGRRSGGRGAQVVAGTRLLQPCAQPARRGAAGRGAVRRRVSPSYDEVRSLRGVGDYTAAAVCSAAYDAPCAVLDGNVFRVLARLFDIDLPIDSTAGKRTFAKLAQMQLDKRCPGRYNQAVMDFGALQCTPAQPGCADCPLASRCLALAAGTVAERPVKQSKTKVRDRWSTTCTLHAATGPCCGGAGKATSGRGCTSFR